MPYFIVLKGKIQMMPWPCCNTLVRLRQTASRDQDIAVSIFDVKMYNDIRFRDIKYEFL